MVEAFEDQCFPDRGDAVRGRSADLRVLDRLEQCLRCVPADALGIRARADLRGFGNLLGHARTDTREGGNEKLRYRRRICFLEHCDQPAEFNPVGMRLDLLRLGGKLRRRSFVRRRDPFRIDVVNRHVRISNGRLL